MDIGDQIVCQGNNTSKIFTIMGRLGEGGQGIVWIVEDENGREYAFKVIVESNDQIRQSKINNIKRLQDRGPMLQGTLKNNRNSFNVALPFFTYKKMENLVTL